MIIATTPIIAANDMDLAKLKFLMNKKYSAGINVLRKPMRGHHLNGIGSLINANSVLQ